MVIKVYISGISGNKEVKKRQQRVLLILDSKNIKYEVIDIAEPGAEEVKDFMQNTATSPGATISDPSPRHPLPPQLFNDDVYCGDYDQFDMANEVDEMEKFLKIEVPSEELISNAEIKLKNGELTPDEKETTKDEETEPATTENEVKQNEVPNEQETVESEQKPKEETEVKGSEEAEETEEPKANDESKEDEESESKDDEESGKAKVGESGNGAEDEQTENKQTKKDGEKADEE